MPFGPDASWPGGFNGVEYRDGGYSYPGQPGAQQHPGQQQYSAGHQYPALPASPNYGEHPYASYSGGGYGDNANGSGYAQPAPDAFGYGDPGYSNPGYDGPSSQDAGVPGTRTVRGFTDSGYQGQGGYPALPAAPGDGAGPGYGQAAGYSQPWDYNQPLRYDDDPGYAGSGQGAAGSYQAPYDAGAGYGSSYGAADYEAAGYDSASYDNASYDSASYDSAPYDNATYNGANYDGASYDTDPRGNRVHDSGAYDSPAYDSHAYDRAAYNGSELSRPGIDGLGYDLSEIIGTADFPEFGYDEPSVERLSYDDPRFDDAPGGQDGYGDVRDGSRFDETRLDSFWPTGDDRPGSGFGGTPEDGGRGGVGRDRSSAGFGGQSRTGSHRAPAFNETRLDLGYRGDQVQREAPAAFRTAYKSGPLQLSGPMRFDATRLDNMAALSAESSRTATGLLAPPEFAPTEQSWVDETSLDSIGRLDFDQFTTPALRDSGAFGVAAPAEDDRQVKRDTGSQRTAGRRRGRSSDRRQWLALGAVVVVAAGAITGVLSKFVFSGPSGPAHSISTPTTLDSYTRSPSLEKAMNVNGLREQVIKGSSGQASDVMSAVYAQGNVTPGAGGNQQIFMFVGGHLANSDPASSIASFEQSYPSAQVVPAGELGGEAACVTTTANNESVAMCVWFDNDSFGTLVSPSMSTTQLANTLDQVRPGIEHIQ